MQQLRMHRPDGRMERNEYLSRAREFCARGIDLPQTKILDEEKDKIKSAIKQRNALRQYIKDNLSNEALANSFGVKVRTIEKAIANL